MIDAPPTQRPIANVKTQLPVLREPLDPEEFARAAERARSAAAMSPTLENGFRLMWSYAAGQGRVESGALDLPATPGSYAILGRHTCADVVLALDPEISLRHVMATAYALEDGGTALRLLDLQTTLPMAFEDGVARHSLVATSSFVVRLGRYVLGGVPIVRGQPIEAPPDLTAPPPPVSVHELPAPPRNTLVEIGEPPAPPGSARAVSSVASLPPASSISPFASRVVLAPQPVPKGKARLGFDYHGRAASIVIDEEDLDRGLLVGRDPRCLDRELRHMLPISVSRVHLLVLRDHGRVFAFDTGSTNGTFLRGERVRRAELDANTELRLGGAEGTTMRLRLG